MKLRWFVEKIHLVVVGTVIPDCKTDNFQVRQWEMGSDIDESLSMVAGG